MNSLECKEIIEELNQYCHEADIYVDGELYSSNELVYTKEDVIRILCEHIEAQSAKQGQWIRHGKPEDYFWNCSECKNWIIYAEHDLHKHHFCGNCGCRMDGDSNVDLWVDDESVPNEDMQPDNEE